MECVLPVDENGQPLHADALVALEVSDPSGIPDVIGDDVDLDIPLELRSPAELQRLEAIAEKAGVRLVDPRKLVDAIGSKLDENFDMSKHLGDGTAPPTGSFVSDSFTDADATTLNAHTGETGASYSSAGRWTVSGMEITSTGYVDQPDAIRMLVESEV